MKMAKYTAAALFVALLCAPHSRTATSIRIPGYRCFSTLVCRNTHFSVLRTLEMLHTFAFRTIAIALCLQAVTRSAIAELLRQVIPR